MLYPMRLAMRGFELATEVVMGIDCTGTTATRKTSHFPCMEHRSLVASSSYGLTVNQMYRVGIIISVINDVTSQWKSSFQSLGLWSFIIVFYETSRFLHSAIIEECYFSPFGKSEGLLSEVNFFWPNFWNIDTKIENTF